MYKGFARGRKKEHSVERRKMSTNGATGGLKMPRGINIDYSSTVKDGDDYDYEFVIIIHSPSP